MLSQLLELRCDWCQKGCHLTVNKISLAILVSVRLCKVICSFHKSEQPSLVDGVELLYRSSSCLELTSTTSPLAWFKTHLFKEAYTDNVWELLLKRKLNWTELNWAFMSTGVAFAICHGLVVSPLISWDYYAENLAHSHTPWQWSTSPLLAEWLVQTSVHHNSTVSYWPLSSAGVLFHHIWHQDSATCPHCNSAEETAEHLILQCPTHDQIWKEMWPDLQISSNPRRLWSYLEQMWWCLAPLTGNRRGRERTWVCFLHIIINASFHAFALDVSSNDYQLSLLFRLFSMQSATMMYHYPISNSLLLSDISIVTNCTNLNRAALLSMWEKGRNFIPFYG